MKPDIQWANAEHAAELSTRYNVTRRQFRIGMERLHEPTSMRIYQHGALSAHGL